MKMPQVRFSILTMLGLIAIASIGMAYWQQRIAWESAQKKFVEIIVEGKDQQPSAEQIETVDRLIRHYPVLSQREGTVVWAARYGSADLVQKMLTAGADPESRGTDAPLIAVSRGRGDFELSPLHFAVLNGKTDVCEVLLEAGADVNSKTGIGETPLRYAITTGKPATVRLLLDYGADLNQPVLSFRHTVEWQTRLIRQSPIPEKEREEIIQMLEQRLAEIELRPLKESSP